MCPGFLQIPLVSPSHIMGKSITHFNCDQSLIRSNGKEVIASLHTSKKCEIYRATLFSKFIMEAVNNV